MPSKSTRTRESTESLTHIPRLVRTLPRARHIRTHQTLVPAWERWKSTENIKEEFSKWLEGTFSGSLINTSKIALVDDAPYCGFNFAVAAVAMGSGTLLTGRLNLFVIFVVWFPLKIGISVLVLCKYEIWFFKLEILFSRSKQTWISLTKEFVGFKERFLGMPISLYFL